MFLLYLFNPTTCRFLSFTPFSFPLVEEKWKRKISTCQKIPKSLDKHHSHLAKGYIHVQWIFFYKVSIFHWCTYLGSSIQNIFSFNSWSKVCWTNCHKPGGLKQQKFIGLQFWRAGSLTSRCGQGPASSEGSRGECPLASPSLPVVAGSPQRYWLVTAPLQALPLSSPALFLLCVCLTLLLFLS